MDVALQVSSYLQEDEDLLGHLALVLGDPQASYPLDQYHEVSCPLVQDRLASCLVSYQASCQEIALQEGLLSFEPSLLASVLLCLALETLVLHLASGTLV